MIDIVNEHVIDIVNRHRTSKGRNSNTPSVFNGAGRPRHMFEKEAKRAGRAAPKFVFKSLDQNKPVKPVERQK